MYVGTRCPLKWVKAQCAFSRGSQTPGQESELSGPPRSKELARNRYRKNERIERKNEKHGDKSSDEAKVF